MVQVDIFWSYGLSAGLALAGHEVIRKAKSWHHGTKVAGTLRRGILKLI